MSYYKRNRRGQGTGQGPAEGPAPRQSVQILFGSHAWGQPTEDSDIDLLIVKQTSDRFIDRWVEVRELIADPKQSLNHLEASR